MKYILVAILWILPVIASGNISDPHNGTNLYRIVELTIKHLKGRYKHPVQYNIDWNIRLLDETEIAKRWCGAYGSENSVQYIECMGRDRVEAYYEVSTGTIILKKSLSLDDPYDVGSIIHEVVHFVQDRHGLTSRGERSKCRAWLEYEATLIEKELVQQLDIHIPDWYKDHWHKWLKHWASKLDDNGNCVTQQ
jgi:hypothetical protein